MPELANPPQEVGFPHDGALLPPAGHRAQHTGGLCGSGPLGNDQERSSGALGSPDRFARTPLGDLTGPPAVFRNSPAVLKVKCVTPSEERLQQVWFPTPEGPQEGPHPTGVSLNEASFHNKRKQKDSSLNSSAAPSGVFCKDC